MTDRFERQASLIVRDKLAVCDCTVIGVGAIGRQVALQLGSIGAPRIQLVDFDNVEATNITTQGYRNDQLNMLKVTATASDIAAIDPGIAVDTINDRFRTKQKLGNVVFCCVDSISARAAIWRSLQSRCELWVDARMLGETMRVLSASDPLSKEHYQLTLFAQADAQRGACTAQSTIYTASIAAGLMIHQLSRWLRGFPLDHDLTLNLLASELNVTEVAAC